MNTTETVDVWDVLRNVDGKFDRDHVISVGLLIIRKSMSIAEIDAVVQLCSDLQVWADQRKSVLGRKCGTGREREYCGG